MRICEREGCDNEVKGRKGKRFCSDSCRAADCDVPVDQRGANPTLCSRCTFLARPEVKRLLEGGE